MIDTISFQALLWKPLWGSVKLSLQLLLLIVPLLVLFELIRSLPVWRRFQKIGEKGTPMERMGFSPYTLVPLFTGIFLGIAYGAGVIIKISREKGLAKADLWLLGLFLATCHAVVEDTLIFVVVGGMARWILGPRILLAMVLSSALLVMMKREKMKRISP